MGICCRELSAKLQIVRASTLRPDILRCMNRRAFLTAAAVGSALPLVAQNYSDYTKDPRPDVAEGTLTAGSASGAVFKGSPVVSGPAPEAIAILQPLQRHATGHLEFA